MAKLNTKHSKLKNGKEVVLRSAFPEDAADFLPVMRQVIATSRHILIEPEEFTFTVEQEQEFFRGALDHPDKIWILPLVEGKIVGALNFAPGHRRRNSHQGEFGISMIKECQGLGLGRLMMDAFIEWAISNPRLEQLRLKVHATNHPAIDLYRKVGFIEEGRERRGVKFSDGTYDDVIAMARDV